MGYEQQGRDLIVRLADGRTIVLSGYFDAPEGANSLYLSTDDQITQVYLSGDGTGVLTANYGPTLPMEKWSPLDDLRFSEADSVIDTSAIIDEPAGMGLFAPALLGGLGGAGAIGAGLVGVGLVTGGGEGSGGGGEGGGPVRLPPTVNDPDRQATLTTNTANPTIGVTGTGHPGDTVVVTIGDQSQTTIVKPDSTWGVTFEGDDMPADGTHTAVVVVTEPGGTEHLLDGPGYVIDMTPPAVDILAGTRSAGDVENLADYADGITIGGEGEAGAQIRIEVGGLTRTTEVDTDGTWSFTFSQTEIAGGERTLPVTVTATDRLGNVTVVNDQLVIDTVPHPVSINPVTQNNLVTQSEMTGGFVMTGSTSPNTTLTLVVEAGGQTITRPVTSDSSGNWQQSFPQGTLPSGTYQAKATLSAVDAAGNPSSVTHNFAVDTEVGVAVDRMQAGDNIISGAERLAGITLTGTADVGSTLSVTFGGVTYTGIQPSSSGTWTLPVTTANIPTGSTTATVSVSAVDGNGNTNSATHVVTIDTEVVPLTRTTLSTGADSVLNEAEASRGLTVTGTVEPGSTVLVSLDGNTARAATVSDGIWSITLPASDIPGGTTTAQMVVTATDRVGNVATHREVVTIDREVTPLRPSGATLAGNGVLNAEEAAAGLVVSGTSEPNSSVTVQIMVGDQPMGTSVRVTADANGNWSTTLSGNNLPHGELDARVVVTAQDLAGNLDSYSQSLTIDTVAPGAPDVIKFERVNAGLTRIVTQDVDDTYEFTRVDSNGSVSRINAIRSIDEVTGEENITFGSRGPNGFTSTPVPDGSYLVVDATDLSGNQSSTLMVVNNTNAPHVDLSRPGLSGFDFSAIDLSFAPDADLTITEAQILNITGADRTILIKGGADDKVSLIDSIDTGQTRDIGGETYTIYTVGNSGATILLDEDIQTV